MKSTVLYIGMAVCLLTGCRTTQDPAIIAEREAEDKAWYDSAVQAINNQEFVLEADRINFKRGRFVYVTSNTNFVSVHGNKATIQMAFNSPYAGPNGIKKGGGLRWTDKLQTLK